MSQPTNQQLLAADQIVSTNFSFQIPSINIKLDRQNYFLWRAVVVSALEWFDLDSFILNPTPPAEVVALVVGANGEASPNYVPVPNPNFITWKKKDHFVLLWMKSTLTDKNLALVARSTSSQKA